MTNAWIEEVEKLRAENKAMKEAVRESILRSRYISEKPVMNSRCIGFAIVYETIAIIDLYVWWNLISICSDI